MSKLERITVTMTEEMVATIAAAVESGAYATTSEVIREAMRDWADQQERRQAKLARWRELIAEGEKGPFHDGETVLKELEDYVDGLVRDGEQAA